MALNSFVQNSLFLSKQFKRSCKLKNVNLIISFLNFSYQQNKLMYNLHQYNSMVRMAERQRNQDEKYAKFVLKHEDLKEKAVQKQKQKVESFVREQSSTEKPFVFQDDHYKYWRPLKQFRDIEDSTKFLSYKTFRHKPHYQMDKIFNQRERKEIMQLSMRKEHLVKSKIIPEEQRSRSLRCQGPLNPKIQFRQKKKDHQYLQPKLRFSNITDRQRMNDTAMSFDDKFKTLYKSFEMTKSKIGRATISPSKLKSPEKDSLDYIDDCKSQMTKSKPFYFEKEHSNEQPEDSQLGIKSKMTAQNSQMSKSGGKSKLYFKLAKTMHLFGKDPSQKQQIQQLLKRTQYERKKDLANLRYNSHHQNMQKRPIL